MEAMSPTHPQDPQRPTELRALAAALPVAWRSTVLGRVGDAQVKVLRMDATPYPEESHAYTEGLLVIDGRMHLRLQGTTVTVRAGELYLVPAGVVHAVAPGSGGTLVIFDV